MVNVELTNKNAIYVDGTRITNRSTKWGIHDIICSFICEKDNVVSECLKRGFQKHVDMIDLDFYERQKQNV
jgi:hypothetical protein